MILKPVQASCHSVVPAPAPAVTWVAPGEARDLERLSEWCRTVGPVLVESPEEGSPPAVVESLAILTWNVHVGGGDVGEVVARLRGGEFTEGRPVPHFALLFQEAYREGSDVPADVPVGYPVPRAIVEHPPTGVRRDIRSFATSERLHVLYVPSMRNGTTAVAEDRGTAILSTMPLADLQAIELPFERQRRVALAATVGGATPSGDVWHLRLVAVHMDTSLALTRGGPVVARRRQAEALVEALGIGRAGPDLVGTGAMPMVLGGDFNTWLGNKESALEVLRRAFPETPPPGNASTWRGPLGVHASLDHVFVRGQFRSVTTRRLPGRFGSDHYPLLTVVAF